MNTIKIRKACLLLGYVEPISIELDGTVWLGLDNDRKYLTEVQQIAVLAKATEIEAQELAEHLAQ